VKLTKLSFFTTLEFEDSDPDYACMKKLMEFRDENVIGKTDFAIICSMFELHEKLPPVAKVLYDNGFILPENEIVPDYSHNAVWKHERQNEPSRMLTYSDKYHETTNHQSDRYFKNAEYTVEDLVAKYEYRVLMQDYGKTKKHHKLCTVATKGKVILESREDYETSG
jgi:hypothetical protein